MTMPGFTATEALEPARGSYMGLSAHRASSERGSLTLQGWPLPGPGFGGWPPPIFPNGVPYDPIGTWPTKPPPGWGQPPPPPLPPVPPVAPGAVAGGSILTTPIELGLAGTIAVALAAVAAGIGLGYVIGESISYGVTPDPPTPLAPGGCRTVGPNTQHLITKSYWSCERGYTQTLIDADNDCKGRTGRCTGLCPTGTPCAPFAVLSGVAQIPGFFSCDTSVYYTCQCGC